MRVETRLPLGKLDPGLRAAETPLDLEFSIPATTVGERGILRELVQEIRRETA
jgi:hypothetical protein